MKEWLVFLKSSPDALDSFMDHMKELSESSLQEEHRADCWDEVQEKRGKKAAFDYLCAFVTRDTREEAIENAYRKSVKGK